MYHPLWDKYICILQIYLSIYEFHMIKTSNEYFPMHHSPDVLFSARCELNWVFVYDLYVFQVSQCSSGSSYRTSWPIVVVFLGMPSDNPRPYPSQHFTSWLLVNTFRSHPTPNVAMKFLLVVFHSPSGWYCQVGHDRFFPPWNPPNRRLRESHMDVLWGGPLSS